MNRGNELYFSLISKLEIGRLISPNGNLKQLSNKLVIDLRYFFSNNIATTRLEYLDRYSIVSKFIYKKNILIYNMSYCTILSMP